SPETPLWAIRRPLSVGESVRGGPGGALRGLGTSVLALLADDHPYGTQFEEARPEVEALPDFLFDGRTRCEGLENPPALGTHHPMREVIELTCSPLKHFSFLRF